MEEIKENYISPEDLEEFELRMGNILKKENVQQKKMYSESEEMEIKKIQIQIKCE